MDEDELEMLSEARARLANTQGTFLVLFECNIYLSPLLICSLFHSIGKKAKRKGKEKGKKGNQGTQREEQKLRYQGKHTRNPRGTK